MGALGMGAMFGMGPAMLDPFTSTFRMATHGFRGGGIGGAIGMGGAAMGAYAGMGAMGSFATNQMATGAQNRGMLMNQMGGMMPNAGAGALGFMANQVEQAARGGVGDIRQITGMMQQGVSGGQIDTGSISAFTTSFQILLGNVRQVAQVLNTSLTEAQQAMQTVKSMGVASDQITQTISTMKGIGGAIGASPAQMAQVGARGAAFGRAAGIDPGMGAMGAMTTAGVFGMAGKMIPSLGLQQGDQGRYTQGALRFLTSGRGRNVLGAMFDPKTGGLNEDTAQMMSMGAYDKGEISRMAAKNTGGQQRNAFRARQGELAGQFVSQFGPGGVAPALNAQTTGPRGDILRQTLTGLNRRDLSTLDTLANQGPALRQRLVDEARRGFTEGQSQQLTLGGAMTAAMDQLTKPLREKFQRFGASLTQAVAGATEDLTSEFVRRQAGSGGARGMADINQALRTGDVSRYNQLQDVYSGVSAASGAGTTQWGMQRGSGMAGAIGRSVPMGLRIGAMSPGTGFGEMGGYGMSNEEYNPYMTGAWAAGMGGGFGGGRNAIGAAGKGLMGAGGGWNRAFGGPQMGFMGLGGYGPVQGTARMAGGLTQGAGLAMRGLGGAARMAAPFILGADLMTNMGPQARRAAGYEQIQSGMISGRQGDLLRFLDDANVLSAPTRDLGELGGQSPGGMQPISGMIPGESMQTAGGMSFSGPGKQQFIDEANLGLANQFLSSGGGAAKLRARLGPAAVDAVLKSSGQGGNDAERIEFVSKRLSISTQEAASLIFFDPNNSSGQWGGGAGTILGSIRGGRPGEARAAAEKKYNEDYNKLFGAADQGGTGFTGASNSPIGGAGKSLKDLGTKMGRGHADANIAAASAAIGAAGGFGALSSSKTYSAGGAVYGAGGSAITPAATAAIRQSATAGRALIAQVGSERMKQFGTELMTRGGDAQEEFARQFWQQGKQGVEDSGFGWEGDISVEQLTRESVAAANAPFGGGSRLTLGDFSPSQPGATEMGIGFSRRRGARNARLRSASSQTQLKNIAASTGVLSGLGHEAWWDPTGGAGGGYSQSNFVSSGGGGRQMWNRGAGILGMYAQGEQEVTGDDPSTSSVEGASTKRIVDFSEIARQQLGARMHEKGSAGTLSAKSAFRSARNLADQGLYDMSITAARVGQNIKKGIFSEKKGSRKFWEEFGGFDWRELGHGEKQALRHGIHSQGGRYTIALEAQIRQHSRGMLLNSGIREPTQEQVDTLTSKIQDAGHADAGSEARRVLANAVSSLAVPGAPGGGQPGGITTQVQEIGSALKNFKRLLEGVTGQMSHPSGDG